MAAASLRSLLTRLFLPLSWKQSEANAAHALKRFSDVEFDSAWQYMNAMSYVREPAVQLMLFENSLEEMDHSERFRAIAHSLSTCRFDTAAQARVPLVKHADDIHYFLGFSHESERAVAEEFRCFARASREWGRASALFQEIATEEGKHEREAHASLVHLVGSPRKVARILRKVRLHRFYLAWMRGSQVIGDFMFAIILGALFVVAAPAMRGHCARMMKSDRRRVLQQEKQVAVEPDWRGRNAG